MLTASSTRLFAEFKNYQFANATKRCTCTQRDGGPIGLRSTAALAALIMKLWVVAWQQLLEKEYLDILLYCRYVDNCRNFLKPLMEGWRYDNGSFRFFQSLGKEDLVSGLRDTQRTTAEQVKAMNSLID